MPCGSKPGLNRLGYNYTVFKVRPCIIFEFEFETLNGFPGLVAIRNPHCEVIRPQRGHIGEILTYPKSTGRLRYQQRTPRPLFRNTQGSSQCYVRFYSNRGFGNAATKL